MRRPATISIPTMNESPCCVVRWQPNQVFPLPAYSKNWIPNFLFSQSNRRNASLRRPGTGSSNTQRPTHPEKAVHAELGISAESCYRNGGYMRTLVKIRRGGGEKIIVLFWFVYLSTHQKTPLV